jgi:hypothetical protein
MTNQSFALPALALSNGMEVAVTPYREKPQKGRCAMSSATCVIKSLEQFQTRTGDRRRGIRKKVRLNASLVTANGIASCQVTDISTRGCRLKLLTPLTRHQYLALEVKLEDSTDGVHIPLAQVQWTEYLVAGVEFVYLSHNHEQQVLRL